MRKYVAKKKKVSTKILEINERKWRKVKGSEGKKDQLHTNLLKRKNEGN